MSVDIAVVGVALDATGVQQGEQVVARSFASVGDAADKMSQRVRQSSAAMNAYLQENAKLQERASLASQERARLEAQLAAGEKVRAADYIGMLQLEKQAIEAVANARTAAWAKGGPLFRAEAAAYAENAARVSASTAAKRTAEQATRRFQNALGYLSTAAVGLPGPIGRITTSLGALAVGSALSIGVVAGIAAIATAYDKLTEKSRELHDKTEALITKLREAERLSANADVRESQALKEAELAQAQRDLLQAKAVRVNPRTGTRIAPDQADIDRAQQRVDKVREDLRLLDQELHDRLIKGTNDAHRRFLANQRDEERGANEAKRRAEERQSQVQDLQKAEAAAVTATAKLQRDAAAEEQALQAQARLELENRIRSMDRLSATEKERLRTAGEAVIAAEAQERADKAAEERAREAARVERERQQTVEQRTQQLAKLAQAEAALATARAQAGGDPVAIEAAARAEAAVQIDEQVRKMDQLNDAEKERLRLILEQLSEQERQNKKAEDAKRQAEARYEAALRTVTASFERGFEQIFANGLDGFAGFFDAVVQLAERAAASIAAAMTVRALGIDTLLKNLTGPNAGSYWKPGEGFSGRGATAGNVLGGAGAGYLGGQVTGSGFGGALSGAAGGFAVGGPVGAIVGGVTGLISGLTSAAEKARRLKALADEFQRNLEAFATAAKGGNTALEQSIADAERTADALRQQAGQIFSTQLKNAGTDAGDKFGQYYAEFERAIEQINADLAEYEKHLREEAKLKQVQIGEDLQVRALRAKGLDDEADRLALQLAHQREYDDLVKQFGKDLDPALVASLNLTQALEDQALATEQANKAAEKAAEIAKYNAQTTEDLNVRLLRAQGKSDEADALERKIAHQREVEEALANGADEATIALLKQVQVQEDIALAAEKSKQKMQELADQLYAEARATENLTVRHLRATGATFAADEAAQFYAQQEEKRQAIKDGRSRAYLDQLDRVQAEERAYADQQRQQQQQAAFDQANQVSAPSFLPDSRVTVNNAIGVSEGTAGQMVGIMRSQLSYLSNLTTLPDIRASLDQMRADLAEFWAGGMLDRVDTGLATRQTTANTAAGVPTSNR